MGNKTFVIFRKENKWYTQLLPVKAGLAHTDAADFEALLSRPSARPEAELREGKRSCRPQGPNAFY